MKGDRSEMQRKWMLTAIAVVLVVVAAAMRVAPHPMNFTPIGAMAIFSGAVLREKWLKFTIPLAALFLGDVFIGLHKLMLVVYASFLISVLIGEVLAKNKTVVRIGGAVFLGALQFFLITNFAVWLAYDTYPRTLVGLGACYLGGLPLFWNSIAGDATYAALLFGGYALAERWVSGSTKTNKAAAGSVGE